ncbi:MAG TPA: chemotaxis protein [Lachnospiraceae bacterium]|nr:chemotaxis protein [Lachnospiraceae bacterium]
MMFSKKGRGKPGQVWHNEKSLYPILHVVDSLKEYQKELARKEVESLSELGMVGTSFSGVLAETDQFQERLQDFGQSFNSINDAAGQFAQVREDITRTVTGAQNMMEELQKVSAQVQESYSAMESTFDHLQTAVKEIQHCMGRIGSIADETNILAINASIEAARAGEQGKGFAVVAEKVRELAREIKELTDDVDTGVQAVETGAVQLNESIQTSQETLGAGFGIVNGTTESFRQITEAAEGAASVQAEISGVIEESQRGLQVICQFFDGIKSRYQEVIKHIERTNNLGTTKSAMFEDVDNMLSQIAPIIRDTEPGQG